MNLQDINQKLYFSQLLGKAVYDNNGHLIGKVRDMAVRWENNSPVVSCIKFAKGFQSHINVSWVEKITDSGFTLNKSLTDLTARALQNDEIYVSKWLMDKQVIDRTGAKLERVNDIKLSWDMDKVSLDELDIGIRGLFRRLGLEFLVKRYPDKVLKWQDITPLENKLANLRLQRDYAELREIHPADMADMMEEMSSKERGDLIDSLDDETAADALTEADLETQVQIISQLDEERASDILEEMPPDEAADILGALPEDKSSQLLSKMDREDADEVRELMAYEEDEAGSLMTTEFISFPAETTAAAAIEGLRALSPEAEMFNYIYVVDDQSRLKGVCSLRELILADSTAQLNDFMHSKIITILDTEKREAAYEAILKYTLLAVPVVDEIGEMLGVITIDDVLYTFVTVKNRRATFSNLMLSAAKEEN